MVPGGFRLLGEVRRFFLTVAAVVPLSFYGAAGSLPAQCTEVINESFEDGMMTGMTVGSASIGPFDPARGCPNQVLQLTPPVQNQGGFAWFQPQFDLSMRRVEVEFDVFIGRSTTQFNGANPDTSTPADGVSVIFQFDSDLSATGGPGGNLGTGNFRGNLSPYIAVAFDIWDNAFDPESGCDNNTPATCHIELNQNVASPIDTPSNQTNADLGALAPNFTASADVYGSRDPAIPAGSCIPGDLIHVRIIFDRKVAVILRGGIGESGGAYPETRVLEYEPAAFPARLSNIGFAASTGGRVADHWVDNVVVRECDSLVTETAEPLLLAAAMNAGGDEVDATAELGFAFRADGTFGEVFEEVGDIETGIERRTSRFGRVGGGTPASTTSSIDVTQISGAGPLTEDVLQASRSDGAGMRYLAEVIPDLRYRVSLYFAENSPQAITPDGRGDRPLHVSLNGERVLTNWSAAAAAGNGIGDPTIPCGARLNTAVRIDYEVDAPNTGKGSGLLTIDVDPGDATLSPSLNAVSFEFVDAIVKPLPITGPMESYEVEPPDCSGPQIVDDFSAGPAGMCPTGWVCRTNNFAPRVEAGRFKILDDATGGTATTVYHSQVINPRDQDLHVEFDLFMANPDGGGNPTAGGFEAADGVTFFIRQGTTDTALGGAGGAIGIPAGTGMCVEFDTWFGGGNDPSGFNNAQAYGHVGINNLTTTSFITNVGYDSNLRPVANGGTGWVDFFHANGMHVEIDITDGQNVSVTITGTAHGGLPFGPTVVAAFALDASLLNTDQARFGFSAGTGARTHHAFVDNFEFGGCELLIDDTPFRAQALADWDGSRGELHVNSGGPTLFCSATRDPAPGASGDPGAGGGAGSSAVIWIGDEASQGTTATDPDGLYTVSFVPGGGGLSALSVARSNMGDFDARGTTPGLDDNDKIFHSARVGDCRYDIPVENGEFEVTVYFANLQAATAGTGQRFFHVDIDGTREMGFEHCEFRGRPALGAPFPNPAFGFDELFDPVGAAERLYAVPAELCRIQPSGPICPQNGVTAGDDPDQDFVPAREECGNAAAFSIRRRVMVADGVLTIAVVESRIGVVGEGGGAQLAQEPISPNRDPLISGFSVSRIDTTPPAPPLALAATAGTIDVSLDWTDSTEPDFVNYVLKRSETQGGPYTDIATLTESEHVDTDVVDGTTYCYVVCAVDDFENRSGPSNEACATPDATAPAAPANLTAEGSDGQVDLDWDDNVESDLDMYVVKRSETQGGPYTEIATVSESSHADTTVVNGTTYYYTICAVDELGNVSGPSNEANATPSAGPIFVRGDADGSGDVPGTTADMIRYANVCFLGTGEFPCRAAADLDGDGQVCGAVTDIVYLANFLFLGSGPAPPLPFPGCGIGNEADIVLGCESHPCMP
jgi:hypothetical protein